ncbi:unnamed protein product [Polarella glacialis]|uniref:Cytosine-specific methyltransferase n=1 Tax=Polarella glacialis TaxID=89957 RepID=A0A813IB94_POLGL|nr:unnamed protein product [Polarella glacialis]
MQINMSEGAEEGEGGERGEGSNHSDARDSGLGAAAEPSTSAGAERKPRSEVTSRLASRVEDHGGIPVGVVVVEQANAETFCQLLVSCLGKFTFKGTDRLPDGQLVFHLPHSAATMLETGAGLSDELVEFMEEKAEFFSGVRLQDDVFGRAPSFEQGSQGKAADAGAGFTFAEIFAGIGGFRLGLEPLGGRCVLASEIDKAARETYMANFGPDSGLVGDITSIYADKIPRIDMLTAGFPCQPFSCRGAQRGTEDPTGRGQLYFELVRLLKACRPKAFLFENVAGLVIMDGGMRSRREKGIAGEFVVGRTFEGILGAFEGCGYDVSWKVINARHCLPQFRERVYIVGFRSDLKLGMEWGLDINDAGWAADCPTKIRDILEPSDAEAIASAELKADHWDAVHAQCAASSVPLTERAIPLEGKAPTLISSYHKGSNYTSKYVFEEADGTVRDGEGGNPRPRFLTPRECGRVMGFPDSFVIPGVETEQKRGNWYRQIGNAVCPPVIRVVGERMLEVMVAGGGGSQQISSGISGE